jgi:hypothetical protein
MQTKKEKDEKITALLTSFCLDLGGSCLRAIGLHDKRSHVYNCSESGCNGGAVLVVGSFSGPISFGSEASERNM